MKAKAEDAQNRAGSLRRIMMEAGACLVGFADLSCLSSEETRGYPIGIGFALEYDLGAVDSLPHGESFLRMKADVEEEVKRICAIAAAALDSWGYGYTRISTGVPADRPPFPPERLPQKTVATLAPSSWCGRFAVWLGVGSGVGVSRLLSGQAAF